MGRLDVKSSAILLEKIKESLDRLNEKMEVFIEIQKQEASRILWFRICLRLWMS